MSQHTATLFAMTTPLPGVTSCEDTEALLAYCARVSSAANQDNHSTGFKLLKRLIMSQEWSPLEQVTMNFEIETNRRIARQMLRHWTLRPQEFSQRYAKVPDAPYITEARLQHPTDRQMSVETDDQELQGWWCNVQQEVWALAIHRYNEALDKGIAKEVACAVIPEGMAPSRMYMQGTLRTWIHYTLLRTKTSTQKEHRVLAQQVWEAIKVHFPNLSPAVGLD